MFFPVISLVAYWLGGEVALVVCAVVLPSVWAFVSQMRPKADWLYGDKDALTGSVMRDGLIAWLADQSAGHAAAFRERAGVRIAIDQEFAEPGDSILGAREVAFFPPVTGG